MSAAQNPRWVQTEELRAAMRGRETEVIDSLGIQWRQGNPRIRCPYPDHVDEHPSWRWDQKKGRAYCTCRSGDALHVVMKVEGLSFVAAKVRVAEMLGRQDLIERRASRETRQRSDADSLLNHSADNRDDSLVWAYLGFRLGIQPQDVPHPSTKIVGHKALGYFDPPARKEGKSKHVGDYPAAVFATIDRDGNRHAHRIYLAADGQGKAELGVGADGEKRDPKKSAKKIKDERTTGLAVVWGDASTAETALICEGIETGAAIALAFTAEIAAGKAIVAACISAGGIQAFRPWRCCKHVVVAADRDEATKDGQRASRQGEIAARRFAETDNAVGVSIALPGAPGEKVDWLDILRRGGVEAVRIGIEAAVPHERELKMPPGYEMRDDGLWYREGSGDHEREHHLCGPIEAVAQTRDAEGLAWGLLLRWKDSEGRQHEWPMPCALLAGDGADIRRQLLDGGLHGVAPGQRERQLFLAWLGKVRPKKMARCVTRVGWHGDTYVLPDTMFGASAEPVLLQTERTDFAIAEAGSLPEWQERVASLCRGNSRLMFAVATAFTAPLLDLVGAESGGFHFKGRSSTGKTTALVVAASAWGGKDYVRQWRATTNGLEGLAAMHCDGLLALDELSQIDAKDAGQAAYMLSNGSGKNRAGRTGERRKPPTWRIVLLSTGEIGIADKVAEEGRGRRATAGQEVRMVDIPSDAGAKLGVFEDIHGSESGDAFANRVRQAAHQYHGTAIQAFLEEITRNRDEVAAMVRGFRNDFVTEVCVSGADGQVKRVADRFGLVAAAGELAIALGILPWLEGEAKQAATTCFDAWLASRGDVGPAEIAAGIAAVRKFIEAHGEARFAPWDRNEGEQHPVANRAGFRRRYKGELVYLIFPESWKEILAGYDRTAIGNALAEQQLLVPDTDETLASRHKNPETGNVTRFYVIRGAIFGDEEEVLDAAATA